MTKTRKDPSTSLCSAQDNGKIDVILSEGTAIIEGPSIQSPVRIPESGG